MIILDGKTTSKNIKDKLKNENAFTFPMDVKTVNYGLGSSNAYVLFYVSIDDEIVYYLTKKQEEKRLKQEEEMLKII